jgi:hypothetical protein
MTDDPRLPPIVEGLVRTLVGGSADERDERASTFARGLALGVLVGAAIAGSTIWQRRMARRASPAMEPAAPAAETSVEVESTAG